MRGILPEHCDSSLPPAFPVELCAWRGYYRIYLPRNTHLKRVIIYSFIDLFYYLNDVFIVFLTIFTNNKLWFDKNKR
jgi:hypothetical protein